MYQTLKVFKFTNMDEQAKEAVLEYYGNHHINYSKGCGIFHNIYENPENPGVFDEQATIEVFHRGNFLAIMNKWFLENGAELNEDIVIDFDW